MEKWIEFYGPFYKDREAVKSFVERSRQIALQGS